MAVSKTGVLTFHRCINYGSYWQARALTEGLIARGHSAELLDHHSNRVNVAEWKCAYNPVLPSSVPPSDYSFYRQKIERFFQAFQSFKLSPKFDLDRPETMLEYDVVVVGSDEVWNLFHPWYGKNPMFYGEGINAERLISYAASFGNYPASLGVDQTWGSKLLNFEHISVRDENSQAIVRNALGIEPPLVLDPCLQFLIQPEERKLTLQQPYLAVYGHNFSSTFVRSVQQYATEKKIPLVSIGYRNDWADKQWLTADPHEFAHFIQNALAVATNFFHGCIFALKFEKPFVCEATTYRSFKVQGLMATVKAEHHLVNENSSKGTYRALLENDFDTGILSTIKQLQSASNEFLDEALGFKQLRVA
ncbi:MAG TPA: polysaccharide pyruvyl transferase family protein [Chitinophagaceae bacterium]|nr:polysaccharide pyruvyl transferase family protein [Chitinophagaceae bacterium]